MEARLRADSDLVMRLGLVGYTGPEWDAVAERLAGYGLRVLTAWILNGTIKAKCVEKGWAGPWHEDLRDYELASDLATLTVVVALTKFRDSVLIPGRWSPNGGASLATYYVGQCLLRWGNVYQEWAREEKTRIALPPRDWTGMDASSDGSINNLLDRLELDETAPQRSEARQILELKDNGFSWEEIAAVMHKSVGSVRGTVRRLRESIQTNTDTQEAS